MSSVNRVIGAGFLSMILLLFWANSANAAGQQPADLTDLSLEELMHIEITSVSKKPERLADAAAAIFVITQEDIRRSGVMSIPEALRMVPGLQVARIDANKWAISSRGFNSRFANKLLVLMDGRTVYDPVFSGVFWDVQDTMLEDIDRIEVIRGPGATLWGANAVNGVINIITKSSKDTQGVLLSGGAGTEERGFGNARFGGKIREKGSYRVYAKYFDRDESVNAQGDATADDWRMSRAGFRTDWNLSHSDDFTFQGDIYDGETGQQAEFPTFSPPYTETAKGDTQLSGGNLLTRWQHTFSETSDMSLQFYYDRTEREQLVGSQDRDTLDIDLQHRFAWGSFQEIIWGLGYRYTHDDISVRFPPIDMDPDSQENNLFSAFIQDEITVLENRLRLILGSKFEHNDYTGFEIQPSGRIVWTPHEDHTLWTAVSRAVRTPSRQENDVEFIQSVIPPGVPENPGPLPAAVAIFGNDDLESEELVALELGYRVQASNRLSFDFTAFYNIYNNLFTTVPDTPFMRMSSPPPYVVIPLSFANKMDGETYGMEVAAKWRPLDWWQLHLSYTFLKMDLDVEDGAIDPEDEGDNPEQQASVRSSMDLPWDLELDLWLRYVDSLSEPRVPSYTTLDVRLGWQPLGNLEISIVGQNLLGSPHAEFIDEQLLSEPTEIERSVYGKITWRF